MKKILIIGLALAVLFTMPVFAGDHKKCDKPVQDCLNSMVQKLKSTGFIGVELDKCKCKGKSKECDCKKKGMLTVKEVIEGSPAEKVGIQPGDILFALNGIQFSEDNWDKIAKVKKPGAKVAVTIKRNGQSKEIKLTLVPMPADLMAEYIGEHMIYGHGHEAGKVAKK